MLPSEALKSLTFSSPEPLTHTPSRPCVTDSQAPPYSLRQAPLVHRPAVLLLHSVAVAAFHYTSAGGGDGDSVPHPSHYLPHSAAGDDVPHNIDAAAAAAAVVVVAARGDDGVAEEERVHWLNPRPLLVDNNAVSLRPAAVVRHTMMCDKIAGDVAVAASDDAAAPKESHSVRTPRTWKKWTTWTRLRRNSMQTEAEWAEPDVEALQERYYFHCQLH